MHKIFIDESGIASNQKVWTYSAICGFEKEINQKYNLFKNEIKPLFTLEELKYNKIKKIHQEKIMNILEKYNFNYYIIYYPEENKINLNNKIYQNNLKLKMSKTLILYILDNFKDIKQIVFDKGALSNKHYKKLTKILKYLKYDVSIVQIDSKKKCGIQISDLYAGALRKYIMTNNLIHKKVFEKVMKSNVNRLDELEKIQKIKFKDELNSKIHNFCFETE